MPQAQEVQTGELEQDDEWGRTQRAAVLGELQRILADPAFSKSKRCGDLLRHLVDHGLSDSRHGPKERTLGVEVFGREADYDNNADPIVRRTANEIRKRLAQYYQELDDRQAVRIHLHPGSYLPEFDFNGAPALGAVSPPDAAGLPERRAELAGVDFPQANATQASPASAFRRIWMFMGGILLFALAAGLTLSGSSLFRSSQYLFWRPLLQVKEPPIVCVADDSLLEWNGTLKNTAQAQAIAGMIASRGATEPEDPATSPRAIPYVDANVAHQLAGWLSENGRSTILQPASRLSLQDFRHRPAILIGGFDNPWTLTLLSGLRFSPRVDPEKNALWVRDAQNPANHDWLYAGPQSGDATVDYAVITRFLDSETGNWIVAVAGLGQHGTDAASQLLVDPALASGLPGGVRSKQNFQMVIKTNLIKGNTGPPQLVAFYAW